MWFSKPTSPKKSEEIRVPEIRFLGKQDGPSERLLKQGGLLGGDSQVYIPKVNSNWLVHP